MRPLLGLLVMVKDESKSVRGVIESALPFVDQVLVVDTGSTDDTVQIAREALANTPNAHVLHEPWSGYASTRNRVLQLHKELPDPTEFTLFLSADEFLRKGEALRTHLEEWRDKLDETTQRKVDCHFVNVALGSTASRQPRVLRTDAVGPEGWQYDDFDCGVHEVPVFKGVAPDGMSGPPVKLAPTCYVEHTVGDPIKHVDTIWEVWIPLLREALERNPNNERAIEYLAQSLECMFPHAEDAEELKAFADECVDLYLRRFELPFINAEQMRYLFMQFLDTARFSDRVTPKDLFPFADQLCRADETRPEPFLVRAEIAAKIEGIKVSLIYDFAAAAAIVAEKSRRTGGPRNSSAIDLSCEWKAHRLAAICAAQVALAKPEARELAQQHINAGLAVGGPWVMFKSVIDQLDGKKPETAEAQG